MARHDVSPHMTKWWKAVRPDEGQVSFHFAMFCCALLDVAGSCRGESFSNARFKTSGGGV